MLPSYSDILYVTSMFWHGMLPDWRALLSASYSLWHDLKWYVCVGSSDAGKRLVREEDEEGSDEERITMTVNRSAIDRERRREAFLAAQDAGS